jgi:hypothetical protein
MPSDKYEILIHDTLGEDFSYIAEIDRHRPMFYPTLHDTMASIGPVLATKYEKHVHTSVLKVVDFKHYRVIEMMVDGVRPTVAIIREIKNPLQFRS